MHPRLALRAATGTLRAADKTGAAELAIADRSDSPRFSRFYPAVLGCIERGESSAGEAPASREDEREAL